MNKILEPGMKACTIKLIEGMIIKDFEIERVMPGVIEGIGSPNGSEKRNRYVISISSIIYVMLGKEIEAKPDNDFELKPQHEDLLDALYLHADNYKQGSFQTIDLYDTTGFSAELVKRFLNELQDQGLLQWHPIQLGGMLNMDELERLGWKPEGAQR